MKNYLNNGLLLDVLWIRGSIINLLLFVIFIYLYFICEVRFWFDFNEIFIIYLSVDNYNLG